MKYFDPRNPWLVVFIVSLAIVVCSLPGLITSPSPAAPTSTPVPSQQAVPSVALPSESSFTPKPAITYQPTFEAAPCAFPVPRGYDPECGYLIVPENRDMPDSRSIRLHVGIFRNRAGTPNRDPVLKISGGPGSSALNTAGYLLSKGMDAVLASRDFVVFDQRGTGYSRPRLDCPERVEIAPELLGGRLSVEESRQAIIESFRRCRERLIAEGIDLSAYNSAASAADINDLRTVLGYDKLNLYAISYGTRLALTLMRDYPNAVRSAVLDSAYPLEVNLYTTLAPNAERAFNVFFNDCSEDLQCSGSYPDLRTVFYDLVDELNARPVWVPLFIENGKQNVRLDGGLLIDVLFGGLYDPAVSATMPQMIYEVQARDYTIVGQRLEKYFEVSSALGMQMAVQCAEEFPFGTLEEIYAAAQGVQPQIAAFFTASVEPLFAVCSEWTVAPPDPRENLPVSSDVPTLVLAGVGDPITPPDWGRMVAGDLSQAYFHEFPGSAHWVVRSSSCAVQMALAFWEDPTVDPGSLC
jgi:pimeloyl-ACP methyl ester carboxylesterase